MTSSSSVPAPAAEPWYRFSRNSGVNVALIEAGPMLNPAKDYKEHKWPSDYEHRGGLDGGIYSTNPLQAVLLLQRS